MLLIELHFLSGRFHATPWGRNVNEGEVEWPPSPFRLARALVDACHRRYPQWEIARLEQVLQALASPPCFYLPPARASHTRSYLSSNDKDPNKKQKIFDAFAVVDKSETLLMGWDVEVDGQTIADLDELLGGLNYLGRSESWVRARVARDNIAPHFNCFPATDHNDGDSYDIVDVACLKKTEDYQALSVLPKTPVTGKGKKAKGGEDLSWLQAVGMSTKTLLDEGWSGPPALEMVRYRRKIDALGGDTGTIQSPGSEFCSAKYILSGPVLPPITDTVMVAQRVRQILMGIHRKIMGGDKAAVSPVFSGKSKSGDAATNHQHAFIMPLDEDGDGRLDHLIIRAANPFSTDEVKALDSLRKVWQSKSKADVSLVLTSLTKEFVGVLATTWISKTPFVTSRNHRKGRGSYDEWIKEEIRRECKFHQLPQPVEIIAIDRTQGKGRSLRWMEFTRSRKSQSPMRGHGFILRFAHPVDGPFVLGSLCHFGLGLFERYEEKH